MARPGGLEPPTIRLEGGCSIQLSYGRQEPKVNSTRAPCQRTMPRLPYPPRKGGGSIAVLKARVVRSSKRKFDCRIEDTGADVQATAPGSLIKENPPVVGDVVFLERRGDGGYTIKKISSRRNSVSRNLVREGRHKVSAANVDAIVVVVSVSKPKFKRGIIDRFLIRAHQWGIEAAVVFNKMDEHRQGHPDLAFERRRLRPLGVECFEISALFPEKFPEGFSALKRFLRGKLALFLGQSGVGKSLGIMSLSGHSAQLATGSIGRKSGKGSHTTSWSEIVGCGDFEAVDSPGIRQFSLEDVEGAGFIEYWPDLEEVAVRCRFNDCGHTEASGGCAFHPEGGPPDVHLLSRLESYLKILDEISQTPEWIKRKRDSHS